MYFEKRLLFSTNVSLLSLIFDDFLSNFVEENKIFLKLILFTRGLISQPIFLVFMGREEKKMLCILWDTFYIKIHYILQPNYPYKGSLPCINISTNTNGNFT